jgi:integrase
MLNISFNLKDPQINKSAAVTKETAIICVIRYKSNRLKYYTGEKVHPKFWDNRKENKRYQTVKNSLPDAPEFNARLEKIRTTVKDVFRRYQNENGNVVPTTDILKELLDTEFQRGPSKPTTFMSFFNQIIEISKDGVRLQPRTGKPISKNTIKTYVTTFTHLCSFEKQTKRKLDFADIDMLFYREFTEYLTKSLKLATNSIAKHFQIIKMIMNEATELQINSNYSYKSKHFAVVREVSDSIYLSLTELQEIENLDLTQHQRLDRVRDFFLIGCYTGLRFQDNMDLKIENIDGALIRVTQRKTGDKVVIPLHKTVRGIIEKYNGELPAAISNQKTK